jgi:hypothetical protein
MTKETKDKVVRVVRREEKEEEKKTSDAEDTKEEESASTAALTECVEFRAEDVVWFSQQKQRKLSG